MTDGATSVDGCFNSSLPLYILSMLFIRQKYRISTATQTSHHIFWLLFCFFSVAEGESFSPCDFLTFQQLNSYFKYLQTLFICLTSFVLVFSIKL